ncbi:MAG: glycerophosphoryl diester phosphodiesterase membrane domain-containing protein [Rariglobus sp.]|nr:glycerophosphoryl diester phosphodiesterase membrane domain-containing protein [Rariglobus sp.]
MIKPILSDAWRIYRERFGVIALIVTLIWLPCNLVDSYFTYFVFDPEDFRGSFKLTQFLENFFGIIATAGVTYVVLGQTANRPVGYGDALGVGFSSWGRMWITRFLYSVAVLVGLLLLVIPGIYLGTRWAFAESIVIAEDVSGPTALRRSFDLTRGRFWPVFWLIVLTILIIAIPLVLFSLPVALVPVLDHWLINVAFMLPADIAAAFATVVFTCGYRTLSEEPAAGV